MAALAPRVLLGPGRSWAARTLSRLAAAGNAQLPRRLFVSPMERVNVVVVTTAISSSSSSSHSLSSGSSTTPLLTGLQQLFQLGLWLIKRTFQPSLIRRKRKHGFLARTADKDGQNVLNRRRTKGRRKLCA